MAGCGNAYQGLSLNGRLMKADREGDSPGSIGNVQPPAFRCRDVGPAPELLDSVAHTEASFGQSRRQEQALRRVVETQYICCRSYAAIA